MNKLAYATLVFALAQAAPAFAATPSVVARAVVAQTPPPATGQTGGEDEDEGEEEEGTQETTGTETAPTGTETPATGPTSAPAAGTETAPTTTAPANSRAQELVSGAPLYNPNVAVHIVQKKQFSDKGRHELTLFPAVAQVNGKFTQHFGTALNYVYHLNENFGVSLTPQFNWINNESDFNQELINKVREEAQAATSLLLNWGVMGGVEVAPIYGKFAWYENSLAQYSVILTGGAGYGSTRHQLKPDNDSGPATFGDTGNRFIGSVGGGFRVLLGDRFAIRLEIRDIVYTARVDNVNGCDVNDLSALDAASRANKPLGSVQVSGSCKSDTFEGVDEKTNFKRSSNIPLALNLVRDPTSDVLNLVSFFGGVSYIF